MNGIGSEMTSVRAYEAEIETAEPLAEDSTRGPLARIGASACARTITRMVYCAWFSLLITIWPSSDWIGLLALSQALLAAAFLVKSSSAGSGSRRLESNGRISAERGDDHVL